MEVILAVALVSLLIMALLLPFLKDGEVPQETSAPQELVMTKPEEQRFTTVLDKVVFEGTSDPGAALTVNGQPVQRQEDGSFSLEVVLEKGNNTVTVVHKNKTVVYTIEYGELIYSLSPQGDQSYPSGGVVKFAVVARPGSTVVAHFGGESYSLSQTEGDAPEGFVTYAGACMLPNTNRENLSMGQVSFTVTSREGMVMTASAQGQITCLKKKDPWASDSSVTPSYGNYINVGSGYIAEVVTYCAETFNGTTVDDYSRPTNNYLPEGTLDYCDMDTVYLGRLSYAVLRSGQRVYMEKRDSPTANMVQVVKCYEGQLPDHNEIGFVSMEKEGSHTVLTLSSLWKAPFYFELLPQRYQNPSNGSDRNYSVTAFTAEYVDITFCYATVFTGTVEIPVDSQVFSRAELTQRESDCTLRLYLKEKGGFYGWDVYYNDQDQLCFQFLEPAQVTAAENAIGADLSGVKIVIDVGHGGFDPGTVGNLNGTQILEADRNMGLAQELKQVLEAAGATVVMTRTEDVAMTVDQRNQFLRQESADLCISVHHNAIDGYPNYGGF